MKKLSVDKKNYRKHERTSINRTSRRSSKKVQTLLEKFAFPKLITDEYMKEHYGKPVFSIRKDDGTLDHWYKNTGY